MTNALTIDVENYYSVMMRDWMGVDSPPTEAVVRNTLRILEILDEHGVKATFFILGEVAETFPQLVRDIAARNHEVGVHGFYHHQVFKLSRDEFSREVGDTKKLLEDITGQAVEGHRAPAFSIGPDTQWALEVLAELDFRYDSSIYPISGRRYGWPGFRRDIHEMSLPNGATIIEAPLSTVRIFGKALPACGGGYLRHFPYWYTRWAMRRIQRLRPSIVYIHPYDSDTDPPPADFQTILETTAGRLEKVHVFALRKRHTVEHKLVRLLSEFRFAPLRDVIGQTLLPNRLVEC